MRLLLLLLLAAPAALPWGPAGHHVVALIAEHHLPPETLDEIARLLEGQSMADASTWADDVRSLPNWSHTGPWHYVNIPDGETYRQSKKARGGDVLHAIERFRKNLARRRNSPVKRADALRFLIHFIADLHQPLHVGRAEDRGGNLIEVFWFGAPSNLHRVWDSGILGRRRRTDAEWVAELDRAGPEDAARRVASKPLDWARESQAFRADVYRIGDGRLGARYYDDNLPIVRERLLQAGLRLAAFLQQALGAHE
jgi:hypothetical protein